MYGGNARQWDRQPNGVVLDTYHWRQFRQDEAERELERLGGLPAVKMVHLKLLSQSETQSFLGGGDTNSALLREFTSQDRAGKVPIIIEAKNDSLGEPKGETLARLAGRVKEVLS